MPDKKPRKVRKDKGVKRGSLKDQRFMKEMEPLFGPFDPKKLEEDKFMKDMSELFIVHKTKEQLDREHVEAGIKYNQSLPPNERVMFNMDLLRHIGKFVPAPLKDATVYAMDPDEAEYIKYLEGFTAGKEIDFYHVILELIHALQQNKQQVPIYETFLCVPNDERWASEPPDAFESIYTFLKLLKIDKVFNFRSYYFLDLVDASKIFGSDVVDDKVEMALDYYNSDDFFDVFDRLDLDELEEADLTAIVPLLYVEDDLSAPRRAQALERLIAVGQKINLKDKVKRK